jgi:hypothetical protein
VRRALVAVIAACGWLGACAALPRAGASDVERAYDAAQLACDAYLTDRLRGVAPKDERAERICTALTVKP